MPSSFVMFATELILRAIKSARIGHVVHVACVRETKDKCKILIRNPKTRKSLWRPKHSVRITLKWSMKKKIGLNLIHLAQD